MAGLVLARSSAGMADSTIRGDLSNLQQIRDWFGRPLWEMGPSDADAYFGRELRGAPSGTRLARASALSLYFEFLELRHKVELHSMTGRIVECPLDEVNRPRGNDIRWELGRFGKLHVRLGKGSRGSGPRERMVPLLNDAGRTLRWFIEDVWGQFGDDHTRHGAPLFPSERRHVDQSRCRASYNALRVGLAEATAEHLPSWAGRLTPHVLRHYCASQLYLNGVDLISIQGMYGHAWVATTMKYVHVQRSRIEDAWIAGQKRAAARLEGLM